MQQPLEERPRSAVLPGVSPKGGFIGTKFQVCGNAPRPRSRGQRPAPRPKQLTWQLFSRCDPEASGLETGCVFQLLCREDNALLCLPAGACHYRLVLPQPETLSEPPGSVLAFTYCRLLDKRGVRQLAERSQGRREAAMQLCEARPPARPGPGARLDRAPGTGLASPAVTDPPRP